MAAGSRVGNSQYQGANFDGGHDETAASGATNMGSSWNHSRGGHGRYGMGAGGGGHRSYGQGGSNNLPPNYVCDRCKVSGHEIRDCPRNGDPLYNPSQAKGIPQNHQWRTFISREQFDQDRDRIHKSLMK